MSTIGAGCAPSDPRGVGGWAGPSSPSLALRWQSSAASRSSCSGSSSFVCGTCRCSAGNSTSSRLRPTTSARLSIPAPRGEILAREGQSLVTSEVSNAVQILPSSLPESVKEEAAEYQTHLAEADKEYVAAGERLKAYEDNLNAYESEGRHGHRHADSCAAGRAARARSRESSAQGPDSRAAGLGQPDPRAVSAAGAGDRPQPEVDRRTRDRGHNTAPVCARCTIKTDAGTGRVDSARRSARQQTSPGVKQEPVSIRELSAIANWPRRRSVTSAGQRKRAGIPRLQGRRQGYRRRAIGPRVLLRPLSARNAGRAARAGQRRRSAGADQAAGRRSRRPAT